jgi:hypothetical protein
LGPKSGDFGYFVGRLLVVYSLAAGDFLAKRMAAAGTHEAGSFVDGSRNRDICFRDT